VIPVDEVRDCASELAPGVVADRRQLHQHPELGFREFETARYVADRLHTLELDDVRTEVATTGVVGLLKGRDGPGPCVLLRADMDALPITELSDAPYASVNSGVMHACGHDAHVAMLLGAARLLASRRERFGGTVKFVFQPSEEANGGGAKPMIEAGVLQEPYVDAAFGLHVGTNVQVGNVGVRAGSINASADAALVTIHGRGGHAARPHMAVDPVVVAAHCIIALQTLVSREVNPVAPAVITVGTVRAGTAANVIPDQAAFRGTIRTVDERTRRLLSERVPEVIQGIAQTFRARAEVEYRLGYPPLVNEPRMTELVRQVACDVVGNEHVTEPRPGMGAEDMAYFLEAVPGAFYRLGVRNATLGTTFSNHHARFDIDEAALEVGVAMHAAVALRYLATAG
jgi:amidohydrolase